MTMNAACVDWEMTVDMLDNLNQASLTRRALLESQEASANGHLNGDAPAVKRLKADE